MSRPTAAILIGRRRPYLDESIDAYRVPLQDGTSVIIDAADLHHAEGHVWTWDDQQGAHRRVDRKRMVYLRRLIAGAGPDDQVDIRNDDARDYRRANLRLATHADLTRRTRKRAGSPSSRFKGVSWCAQTERWRAVIYAGSYQHLGRFEDERAAAEAYDRAARQLFGEFARTNFPAAAPGGATC